MELLERYPPAETAREAARQAVTMLDGVPAPAGEMPVVIGPGGGGVLFHEACGHGLEADIVQKEASIYRGKLGQTLASPLVTGVEDATLAERLGLVRRRRRGRAATRTVLFDRGVLTDYLYDRLRAESAGVPSNGHGRRQSYAHLPIPRMANSHILPGDRRRGRDHRRHRAGPVLRPARRGPGQPRHRRLRVRRPRGLLDRERRAHEARPRREPHRPGPDDPVPGRRRRRATSRSSTACAARTARACPSRTAAPPCGSRG